MGKIRPEEQWAADMMSEALGLPVAVQDDGSSDGMYDLRVDHGGKRPVAAEVVAAADAESIEFWNLVNGDGGRWIEPDLKGGWMVTATPATRVERLRKEVPALLRRLEATGVHQAGRHQRADHPEIELLLRDLGVLDVRQGGTSWITTENPRDSGQPRGHAEGRVEVRYAD